MKLHNIIVASDLAPSSSAVRLWAARLAMEFNSHLDVVHVDETEHFQWPARLASVAEELRRTLENAGSERERRLDETLSFFEQQGVAATTRTPVGRASDVLLASLFDDDVPVDLIVMGRSGTRHENSSFGVTVNRVLQRSPVPVLVVPCEAGDDASTEGLPPLQHRRVICPTVFSDSCAMALDATLALSAEFEGPVDVAHVVRLPLPFGVSETAWSAVVEGAIRDELETLHAEELSKLLAPHRARRCTQRSIVGVSISAALHDLAGETSAELIAMPTHCHDIELPRIGSTTESVVKRSSIPVLVFPARWLAERHARLTA